MTDSRDFHTAADLMRFLQTMIDRQHQFAVVHRDGRWTVSFPAGQR